MIHQVISKMDHLKTESKEEYEEALRQWLEDNPGWIKTSYGTWTNENQNEEFTKLLMGDKNEVGKFSICDR